MTTTTDTVADKQEVTRAITDVPATSEAPSCLSDAQGLMYETQFFGYNPRGVVDTLYNTYLDVLPAAIDSALAHLKQHHPDVTDDELADARAALLTRGEQELTGKFKSVEQNILKKVFSIPANVILPSDEAQVQDRLNASAPIDEHSVMRLERDEKELLNRIKTDMHVCDELEAELQELRTSNSELEKLLLHGEVEKTADLKNLREAMDKLAFDMEPGK